MEPSIPLEDQAVVKKFISKDHLLLELCTSLILVLVRKKYGDYGLDGKNDNIKNSK